MSGNMYSRFYKPFVVDTAFHDWINDVNMGNGLIDLMCDYSRYGNANVDIFIELANGILTRKTNIEELYKLIWYHHPGYQTMDLVFKSYYDSEGFWNYPISADTLRQRVRSVFNAATKSSAVDENDPNLRRIVDIINAYRTQFNRQKSRNVTRLNLLSYSEAALRCDPQKAKLFLEKEGHFFVDEVLDKEIRGGNKISLVSENLLSEIYNIMIEANNLRAYDKERNLIHTDLFESYFGAKSIYDNPLFLKLESSDYIPNPSGKAGLLKNRGFHEMVIRRKSAAREPDSYLQDIIRNEKLLNKMEVISKYFLAIEHAYSAYNEYYLKYKKEAQEARSAVEEKKSPMFHDQRESDRNRGVTMYHENLGSSGELNFLSDDSQPLTNSIREPASLREKSPTRGPGAFYDEPSTSLREKSPTRGPGTFYGEPSTSPREKSPTRGPGTFYGEAFTLPNVAKPRGMSPVKSQNPDFQ
jgi:hypothetical protein